MFPKAWNSAKKLGQLGLWVGWLGVAITIVGLIYSEFAPLKWIGVVITALSLIFKTRQTQLTDRASEPRKLSDSQRQVLRQELAHLRNMQLHMGYIGQNDEAQGFATEIRAHLVDVGFRIPEPEGGICLGNSKGLVLAFKEPEKTEMTAIQIQQAFVRSGIAVRLALDFKNRAFPDREMDI